jgi:peptide chain release factor subunit 1
VTTIAPRVATAAYSSLVRLSKENWGEGPVLSIYVDLDPRTFATPPAQKTQVNSLISEAERLVEKLDGDDKKVLRNDVRLVEEFLLNDPDWPKNARSVVAFASGKAGRFEILKLPTPVEGRVVIESTPYLEPMNEILSGESWCVLIVNRRTARILLGTPETIEEIGTVDDDTHGQHDQGGWSQARYQRSVEEEVKDHLGNAAETMLRLFKTAPFDHLVLGVLPELRPEVESSLSPEILERLAGEINVDIENSSVDDIRGELQQLVTIKENEKEKELLGRLREELGTGGPAASGLEPVLTAVYEGKVDTLLVEDGFSATGVACPKCGWLGVEGSTCPVDGTDLDQGVDIVEGAIQLALAKSGEAHHIRYNPDLQGLGSIAALLRY